MLLVSVPASATPKGSLFGVDLQVGAGLAIGGAPGHTALRMAPITIGLKGDVLLHEGPDVSLFGGLYVETVGRIGLGLQVGGRIKPLGSRHGLRLGASIVGMVVPYTLFGATIEGGYCIKVEKKDRFRPCVDLQGVVFFAGSDLGAAGVAGQLNVLAGVHFNAL
jgi:hypothetical protein